MIEGKADILVVLESKLDSSVPTSQFCVDGLQMVKWWRGSYLRSLRCT